MIYEQVKKRYTEPNTALEAEWTKRVYVITEFLNDRLAMVQNAYNSKLNDEQFLKIQREEKMIETISHFLNDSESVINIYKNAVLSVLDVFYHSDKENIQLKEDLGLEMSKNKELEAFLEKNNLYEQYLREATKF